MAIDESKISPTTSTPPGSRSYDAERVDRLPFGTPEKAERYRTERFNGATGLNWYTSDPTLQFLMRYQLSSDELEWATPKLDRLGALMGGPISERADLTDKNPPRLIKYDRWGHDISEVLLPESALATKRDLIEHGFGTPAFQAQAGRAGVRIEPLTAAYTYMLCQAEIGMTCSMGADAGMVRAMVAQFAPTDVQEHVLRKLDSGEWIGKTGQFFTERTGGSDLGELETTATPNGDSWLLNGFKWFSSNCDGEVFVVLAKPVGAHDGVRGIAPFLVMKHRLDGSRNGMKIRQLKDKLGTKAVPSGEVELVDAEAFMMAPSGDGNGVAGDGHGLARLMALTNVARIGIATMGLGCARRALVESLCYARARSAWHKKLDDQPLMRRKLAEMIVDVEAAQALVFDQYSPANHRRSGGVNSTPERLRIGGALAKLRCARLGITTASDAIEIHGGNGYVETWPVARILRDAQINTLWEGPDNILCLDVRRGIEREDAGGPLLDRIREAVSGAPGPTSDLVARRADDLERAIDAWRKLDRDTGEARLYALAQFMIDVYAGALLVEQAAWERETDGRDRKALVATLYAQRRLADPGPLRGIDAEADASLGRFVELADGALIDERLA
jgi:alkylation response protein AidB-like acyl-CoA dehydrogenase